MDPQPARPEAAGQLKRLSVAALATLSFAGCAISMPAIPVRAPAGQLHVLQGSWSGTYEMTSGTRRNGTITFELEAGRDSATGMVVMTYATRGVAAYDEHAHQHQMVTSEPIAVSFVQLEHGEVSGMLAPYSDPFCGCRLRTTFTGALHGSTIAGTFITVHLDTGSIDHGTWKVTRQARIAS